MGAASPGDPTADAPAWGAPACFLSVAPWSLGSTWGPAHPGSLPSSEGGFGAWLLFPLVTRPRVTKRYSLCAILVQTEYDYCS